MTLTHLHRNVLDLETALKTKRNRLRLRIVSRIRLGKQGDRLATACAKTRRSIGHRGARKYLQEFLEPGNTNSAKPRRLKTSIDLQETRPDCQVGTGLNLGNEFRDI